MTPEVVFSPGLSCNFRSSAYFLVHGHLVWNREAPSNVWKRKMYPGHIQSSQWLDGPRSQCRAPVRNVINYIYSGTPKYKHPHKPSLKTICHVHYFIVHHWFDQVESETEDFFRSQGIHIGQFIKIWNWNLEIMFFLIWPVRSLRSKVFPNQF